MGIIYKATFKNNKVYIGYTSKSIQRRKTEHRNAANAGSNYIFHKAIRKYGFEEVLWDILEESSDEEYLLSYRENFYILENDSYFETGGYNMTFGGNTGTNKFWWMNLTNEDKEIFISKLLENRTKVNEETRIHSLKECWKNDDARRIKASIRAKKTWSDENKKDTMKNKLSAQRKQDWKNGVYDPQQQINMTEQARIAVSGSLWYNDGIKNYRLKKDDNRTVGLVIGRIWKTKKKDF